jgi:hypothetical protein
LDALTIRHPDTRLSVHEQHEQHPHHQVVESSTLNWMVSPRLYVVPNNDEANAALPTVIDNNRTARPILTHLERTTLTSSTI